MKTLVQRRRWKMRTVVEVFSSHPPTYEFRLDCGHLKAIRTTFWGRGEKTRCYKCGPHDVENIEDPVTGEMWMEKYAREFARAEVSEEDPLRSRRYE